MKIKNITHAETNETRTDGRYPIRIGSEVNFAFYEPTVGDVMYLEYVKDNEGNPKEGVIRTSIVYDVKRIENEIIVKTKNSIYYFEK